MSHSTCWRRIWVDSPLLVVGSRIASLISGPSFAHNLGCRCPNGSCEAILDIYTSRTFQWYKKKSQCEVFWPLQSSSEFLGVPENSNSHFRECEWRPHTSLKVGLRHPPPLEERSMSSLTLRIFSHTIVIVFFLDPWPLFADFYARTLPQANLGVHKFPTPSWQVQKVSWKPFTFVSSKDLN